jgi:hypothetical protein
MAQLTARSSTIFIATGRETRVYRSVEDVPPELRQKLVSCTRGINSATILIADKHGREELVRSLQGRPSEVGRTRAGNEIQATVHTDYIGVALTGRGRCFAVVFYRISFLK